MSEHFDEQISQFIDDEMSAEECEFFVRRLQRDGESRSRYLRYQLIGAAVRGEHIHRNAAELRQRLGAAISSDAPTVAEPQSGRSRRVAISAGIAAVVALVVVAVLVETRTLGTQAPGNTSSLATFVDANVAGRPANDPAELTGIQYLIHHTGYSSGLNRTLVHSSVVAARADVADPAVDPIE